MFREMRRFCLYFLFLLILGYPASHGAYPLVQDASVPQDNDTHHLLSSYLVPGIVLSVTPNIIDNPHYPAKQVLNPFAQAALKKGLICPHHRARR